LQLQNFKAPLVSIAWGAFFGVPVFWQAGCWIWRFCGQHLNGNFAACYHTLRLCMVLLVGDFHHSRKVLATGCFTVIHGRLAGISLLLIDTYARTSTFYSS
jgi:hypothetical protein